MKKIISLFMAVILVFSLTACAEAEENRDNSEDFTLALQINSSIITVNETESEIDAPPVIVEGRTLVPIRAIIEAMGGEVEWNQDTQTAELTYNGDVIELTIDSNTAYFNGTANELDTAPAVVSGRTMLPIRFIAESFEFDVDWNSETQTITITKSYEITDTAETAEAAETEEANAEDENTDGNILIVYFSATGTTEKAANIFADVLNADLFEIEPADPYTDDDLNYNDDDSRVSREHDDESLRDIELVSYEPENWEKYDTVFIGYPIWWGIAAWPVSSFVSANDFTDKTVIPFCTSASSGLGESGQLLEEAAGSGNWFDGRRFNSAVSEDDVTEWINELGIQ
ncbi:MAG: flavodoxin [Clostridiales bacterium]|nr:flavodoxin [Clostridiales bacterium]